MPPSRDYAPGENSLPRTTVPASTGPIIGAIIISILLAFGGLYFWGQYLSERGSSEQLPFISSETESE